MWNLIAAGVANVAGEGSYTWNTSGLSGEYFMVKVVSTDDSTVLDESQRVFSISVPGLAIVSPVGGESWPLGSQQNILWTSNIGGYVSITLLNAGGSAVREIAKNVDNDGAYSWQLPQGNLDPDSYMIQIVADGVTKTSPAFSITDAPFIQLTSPVGEEHWAIGTQRDITWNSNIPGNVVIYLYNDGVFKKQISSAVVASGGKYAWSIPSGDADVVASTGYKIKLVSEAQASVTSGSDKSFEIEASPYITVVSPNRGDEQWEVGSRHEISWDSNAGGLVKLELGRYSNSTWNYDSEIIASASNASLHNSYMWTIQPGQAPANDYSVRITSLSGACAPARAQPTSPSSPASTSSSNLRMAARIGPRARPRPSPGSLTTAAKST